MCFPSQYHYRSKRVGRTAIAGRKIARVGELSPDGVVEEYLERWNASGLKGKMREPMLVASGGVVELNLIAVFAEHQHKGYASRALQMLTDLCDENGITVTLVARPMSPTLGFAPGCPDTLGVEKLVSWYARHGFVISTDQGDGARSMVRTPRQLSPKPAA